MTPPLLLLLSLFLSFIPSHAQLVLNGGGMGMGQPQPPTTPDITAPAAPGINTGVNTGINLNGLNSAGMGFSGLEGLNSLNSLNTLNGLNTMGGITGLNSLNGLNTLGALNGVNALGGINAGLGGLGGTYGTLGGLNTAGLGGAGGYGTLGGFNGLNTAGIGANLANYGGLNGFGTTGLMGGLAGNNLANFGAINGLNTAGMNGLTTAGLGLGGANTLGGLQTVNVNPYGTVGYGGMQTMGTTATIPMNTAPAVTNYDPFATFGSGGNTAPATTYTPVTYPVAYNPVTTAAAAAPYTPPATTTTTYVQPATQAAAAPQTIQLPTRVINLPAQTAATSPTSATSNTNDGYGTMLSKLEVPDPSDATTTTRRSRPVATTHTARPRQRSRSRGRPRARPRTRTSTPATEQNVNAITDTANPTSEQLSNIMHQLHTLQQIQIQQAQAQQIQAQQAQDQQTQLQQHLQVAQQRQQQIEALVQAQAAVQVQAQPQAQAQPQPQPQPQAQAQAPEPASIPSIRDQPQPHPEANPNCPALTFTSKMLLVQPGTNANGGSIYKLIFTTTSPSSANWVDVHLMKNPSSDALTISADSTLAWEVNMRMTPVPSSLLSTSRIDSIPSEHPPQQRRLLAMNDPSYTAFEVYLPTVPMKDDDTLAYMLTYGTIKDEKEIACDSEIQIFTPTNTAPPTHLIQQTSQIQPALQSTSHKTSQQPSPIQPTSQQTSQVQQTSHHRSRAITSDDTPSQHPIHDEITSILGTSSIATPACPSITYTPTFNLLVTPSSSNEDTERYYSIVFKGTRGKKINWVDVHVGINTSSHSDSWAQSNFRLIATSPTTFEHTLPVPISNGDSITYQFTYSAGGVQCDSEVHTMSSTALLQAASVTAG